MQTIVAKVGHVYKQRTPYSYPGGRELTTGCNLWRVAATWLGNTLLHRLKSFIAHIAFGKYLWKIFIYWCFDWPSMFLHYNPDGFAGLHLPMVTGKYNATVCGGVEDRLQLRERLQCRDMAWYLDTVYPELQVPGDGDTGFGTVHLGPDWLVCLDPTRHPGPLTVGASPCLQSHHPQQYRHTREGSIR